MAPPIYWSQIMSFGLNIFFYGLNVALFIWLLVAFTRPNSIRPFLGITGVLSFVLSSLALAGSFVQIAGTVAQVDYNLVLITEGGSILKWAQFLSIVNADLVLLWRLYHVSGKNAKLCAVPALLEFIAIVFGLIHWISDTVYYSPWLEESSSFLTQDDAPDGFLVQPVLAALYYVFTILFNIVTTSLLTMTLLQYNKALRTTFDDGSDPTRYYKFLALLLVESGALFTAYLILALIARVYYSFVISDSGFPNVILSISAPVVALYPLAVTLFAEYGKYLIDVYSPTTTTTPPTGHETQTAQPPWESSRAHPKFLPRESEEP